MYTDYSYDNDVSYKDNSNNKLHRNHSKTIFLIILLIIAFLVFIIFKNINKPNSESIKLLNSTLYLTRGEETDLEYDFFSSSVNIDLLDFSSSDPSVAYVEDGVLKTNGEGEAVLTISNLDGEKTTCLIVVLENNTAINSINFLETEKELEVSETFVLELITDPIEAVLDSEIIWSSSDPSVAYVLDGYVEAISSGTTVITAKLKNGMSAKCTINVNEKIEEIFPTDIIIDKEMIEVIEGDTFQIEASILPVEATNQELIWRSSDENIVSVKDGFVTAFKTGNAVVSVKTVNDIIKTCVVVVKEAIVPTSISLEKKELTLNIGEKIKLKALVLPENFIDQLTWTSSNEDVVTVDNDGNIKALTTGKSTISVKTSNDLEAVCDVEVQKIDIKTFDQRNDAMVYYYNSKSPSITKTYSKYKCGSSSCYYPKVYKSSITGNIKVYEYDVNNKTKKYLKTVPSDMIQYVMIPNNTYYLEGENQNSAYEYVNITGELRMIKIEGIKNMRDLGGKTADGGVLKYGKLFRSANPNSPKSQTTATEAFKKLGISVIFDLRETSSFNNEKKKMSSFKKMNSDTGYYLYSKVSGTRKSVKNIMKQIVLNNGVVFHCAIGRDRTGTVGFLLEGILGVPLDKCLEDFELSYLYKPDSAITKKGKAINSEYKTVKKAGGNNDQERFINWFLSGSDTPSEDIELINDFRKMMIDGNPTVYTVNNKKCVEVTK